MARQSLLSVVITSYTTERLNDIYELLDSIKAQSYQNLETIFVAEQSTELVDRVKTHACEKDIANLKVIFNQGEPGLSAARNLGIEQTTGEIIAFVDDDVVLFPYWAEEMVKVYEDDTIIGVTGPAFPLWEDETMSWFPEEFYWIIGCTAWSGWNEVREVRNAWGMNMSFRRKAFESAEVFSPKFGLHSSHRTEWSDPPSEDVDLSLRAKRQTGKRIVYVPGAKVKHRVYKRRLSQRFIIQRSFSVGYQRRMLRKLYPEANSGNDLLSQEHQLLKRIFGRLFPNIMRGFFTNPVIAWRRLSVTISALFCVTLGYYCHLLPPFRIITVRR